MKGEKKWDWLVFWRAFTFHVDFRFLVFLRQVRKMHRFIIFFLKWFMTLWSFHYCWGISKGKVFEQHCSRLNSVTIKAPVYMQYWLSGECYLGKYNRVLTYLFIFTIIDFDIMQVTTKSLYLDLIPWFWWIIDLQWLEGEPGFPPKVKAKQLS